MNEFKCNKEQRDEIAHTRRVEHVNIGSLHG
jgi:hypothetical protein